MGQALKNWLKLQKNPEDREEMLLNLLVSSHLYRSNLEKMLNDYGITTGQYNVLRILKGVYPNGHPRCDIAARMIESSPDITRLIDRLEKQKLVERDRTKKDRRMSITRITKKGIELLDKVKPLLDKNIKAFTSALTEKECSLLSQSLEKMYIYHIK